MILKLFLVDTFVSQSFSGGQVSVALLRQVPQGPILQNLATALGTELTAYLLPYQDDFILRCFTPTVEIMTGGQAAALASARVVYSQGLRPRSQPLFFHSKSGRVSVYLSEDDPSLICLELARQGLTKAPAELTESLAEALGLSADGLMQSSVASSGVAVLILHHQAFLAALKPDFSRLERLGCPVAVSAPSSPGDWADYTVRFFAPSLGVNEGQVNPEIQTALAPFWGARLGRKQLTARHLSSRSATLMISLAKPDGQVVISGRTAIILKADPVLKDLVSRKGEIESESLIVAPEDKPARRLLPVRVTS